MSIYEIGLVLFGAGLGAVATMFGTAYYMVRQFEREQAMREVLQQRRYR